MQNYPQSEKILSKIKNAKNILLNCHVGPDLDSVGSATAMYEVLKRLRKKTTIICPSIIPKKFKLLNHCFEIKTIDFLKYDFSPYDLFLVLDTSSDNRITGSKEIDPPKNLEKIVIDHHITNKYKGKLNILDVDASATTEILYRVFQDWKINITSDIATALYSGIAGDTVFFKYIKDPKKLFSIMAELLEKGANHNDLVLKIYNSYDYTEIKLIGEFLSRMKLEKKHKFVWSAIPYGIYEQFGLPKAIREIAADMFFQSIKGADFGIVILEDAPGQVRASFRSNGKVDVSILALKLGGGGHKNAAAITLHGNYIECVNKILKTAKH